METLEAFLLNISKYISQTLTLALPSLSINGLDPSPFLILPPSPPHEEEPSSPNASDPNYEPLRKRSARCMQRLRQKPRM